MVDRESGVDWVSKEGLRPIVSHCLFRESYGSGCWDSLVGECLEF